MTGLQVDPMPFGSIISGAPTTSETSTSSSTTESQAPEKQLPESSHAESSYPVSHSPENKYGTPRVEKHDPSSRLPSPEDTLKRVEKHRRQTSSEAGALKPKPDVSHPSSAACRTLSTDETY